MEQLRNTLKACLDGKTHEEEKLLDAVNRRGKKIQCRVTCRAFDTAPDGAGVVVFMEEVA
jgi:two-component system CheB/CheR fusion protein